MKFHEYPYTRPDYEQYKVKAKALMEQFSQAKDSNEQIAILKQINTLEGNLETMAVLSSIRHSIDTTDAFYEEENNFWDEYTPLFAELSNELSKLIVSSKFLNELKEKFPKQFFTLIEMQLKEFDPIIIEDLQKENQLVSKYQKLIASAQIEFDGQTYTLPQLVPLTQSKDRSMRERAFNARIGFFEAHEQEIDEIYDSLVKVRTAIAKKLGFNSYVELGYVRMKRSDYTKHDVANYRKQVLEHMVPINQTLYADQAKRLNLDALRYFDEKYVFDSGNPTPKGDPDWILNHGKTMYRELSKETDEFFSYMTEHELLDLVAKKGKAGGGYCTFLYDYKSPFIFSNFNGTAGDVDVLTHEAGHAFQTYCSRNIEIPSLIFPTMESCEIHSMSMEFFTEKWMDLFFEEDAEKYHYMHLTDAFKFIPYGITVDAFQHIVYENPDYTPEQRKQAWRELEKQYLPHKNYEGIDFLERGGWWFQQSHIFSTPFYYIDYTLAQVCALQFYAKMNENYEEAWKDYLHLCKQGGTKSFLGLVEEANLTSPFITGTIQNITDKLAPVIAGFDSSKF